MARRKTSISIGTISMLVGLIMCVIKGSGIALATWSWWAVTAFIWGPIALFLLFMVFVGGVIGARKGVDTTATTIFNDYDDEQQ